MTVLLVLPYLAEDALDIFAIWSDGDSLAQVARCRLFAIVSPSVTYDRLVWLVADIKS